MFVFASEFNAKTHHVQDLFLGKHGCVREVFQTLCRNKSDLFLLITYKVNILMQS